MQSYWDAANKRRKDNKGKVSRKGVFWHFGIDIEIQAQAAREQTKQEPVGWL